MELSDYSEAGCTGGIATFPKVRFEKTEVNAMLADKRMIYFSLS